jgi:NAD(P)H dehydrogenase (quinone)
MRYPMTSPKILIAFYSRNGASEALALATAAGAEEVGAEVRLRRARELVPPEVMAGVAGWAESAAAMNARYEAPTADDAAWADGIIFGSPTRFGMVSSELKAYIDSLGGLWFRGALNGKAGSVFGTTSYLHGGNEATLLSLYAPLAHLGLVIVPLGYVDPSMFRAGTPYGATAATRGDTVPPSQQDLDVAHYQGRRVAEVALKLKSDRSG